MCDIMFLCYIFKFSELIISASKRGSVPPGEIAKQDKIVRQAQGYTLLLLDSGRHIVMTNSNPVPHTCMRHFIE